MSRKLFLCCHVPMTPRIVVISRNTPVKTMPPNMPIVVMYDLPLATAATAIRMMAITCMDTCMYACIKC